MEEGLSLPVFPEDCTEDKLDLLAYLGSLEDDLICFGTSLYSLGLVSFFEI